MNDPKHFLARWSRRKQEAVQPAGTDIADVTANAQATAETPAGQAGSDAAVAPVPFDLASLPSLDSITAQTDVRVFLQPGVPADLAREALRRAWAADPAIRDFIGMAEYAWDFTAEDAMTGFGSLDPSAAKEVFARLTGGIPGLPGEPASPATASREDPAVAAIPESPPESGASVRTLDVAESAGPDTTQEREEPAAEQSMLQRDTYSDSAKDDSSRSRHIASHARRGHGSAIPR